MALRDLATLYYHLLPFSYSHSLYPSGSQLQAILPPKGHLAWLETFLTVATGWV